MITLDTNIIARYLLNDLPDHSTRATQLLETAAEGGVNLFLPITVVAELAHLLHRRLSIPRDESAQALLNVVRMPGIWVEQQIAVIAALEFWGSTGGLSFADCYHLALTKELGMSEIYSFDKKMDRYPGVTRIEP